MKLGMLSKATALSMSLLMLTAGAVWADNVQLDADVVKNGNNVGYTNVAEPGSQACSTRGTPVTGKVTIAHSGNNHFKSLETVSLTTTPDALATSAGITATDGSAVTPIGWGFTNTSGVDSFEISFTTTVPASTVNGIYDVDWVVSGPAIQYTGTGAVSGTANLTRSGTYTVTVNCTATDTTPPDTTITAAPSNPTGSTSASFSFTGTDNVTPAGNLTFECKLDSGAFAACTSPKSYTGLAEGSHTFEVRAKDAANNVDPTPASYSWTIDTSGPSIDCTVPDNTVWYDDNVTVNCTASDDNDLQDPADASFSLSTSVNSGEETASASTDSKTVYDTLGNSSVAGPYTFMVDRKAPTYECTPSAASSDWLATEASFSCTASDGGSGLNPTSDASFTLTTNVGAGNEDGNASTGTKTLTDAVGNSATAGPITGNKVDRKGPVVSVTCPSNPVLLGSSASASWSATDGGSGVSGADSGNFTLDTSAVGSKTHNVAAGFKQDNVGNGSAATSCTYSVIYDFAGFFRPVDNLPTLNSAKAGSAIPIKFSLGGDQGLSVMASGFPKSADMTCTSTAPVDGIEETVTAGQSSLSYDALTGQYNYVWKTEKSWAGTCRTLTVKLIDGTIHQALFKLTK